MLYGKYNFLRYKNRQSVADRLFDVFNVSIMWLVLAVMIVPVLHVVSISFSSGEEVLRGGLFLYPRSLSLEAYRQVFSDALIMRSYLNTIIYAIGHTVLVIVLTATVAYPLSHKIFPFRKGITLFIAFTMFFGGGTIPTYLLMKHLSLINNRLVMIIPFTVSAYNVILFRTFFSGIDKELRESAKLDGAGEARILFQIILPLSKAIIATVGLFTLVGKWNDWFSALIYLTNEKKYPVQMILRKVLFNVTAFLDNPALFEMLRVSKIRPENLQMATIVVISFPIMCIYPFIQRYFAKGVLLGGIKG